MISNHTVRKVGKIVQQRIDALKIGQRMQDLPEELWHDSFKKYYHDETRMGGPNMRLIRLNPQEPSLTVTGYIYNKFVHPFENRYITVREAARLQGFPDEITFSGPITSAQMQVGNAVPVDLARAVFSSVTKAFADWSPRKKNIYALSLFCGAGGMDIGAGSADSSKGNKIKTIVSTDIWGDACESLRSYNRAVHIHGSKVLVEDITKIENPLAFWQSNSKTQKPDLIFGGPPCQAFSQAGKQKGVDDKRGTMIFEFLRFVESINPTAFVIENVSNIRGVEKGMLIKRLLRKIDDLGYSCNLQLLSADNYGAPQKRKRVFFMCAKKDLNPIETPEATHCKSSEDLFAKPPKTVFQAFEGLPPAHFA